MPVFRLRFSDSAKPYKANNHLFKFNNRNTRKRSEICSKLTINAHQKDVVDVVLVVLVF